jgi:hypothetical protein
MELLESGNAKFRSSNWRSDNPTILGPHRSMELAGRNVHFIIQALIIIEW